ncbi:hypothetical protein FHS46_002187 [Variibacter gotjawalensis]|nr:hypothetical protein [Variibacter gotjawalensis]
MVNDAVPASVVAATVTAPAACGGATASMLVELKMLTESAGMPSNVTAAPNRFVPVSVTPVPPVTGPDVGDTLVKVGAAATYVKALVNDAVPASVVAATVTAPAACGGATASTLVELRMLTESAGMPSNVTAAPNRFVPVSVTPVPPVTGPDVGDTLVKVGAAATYVKTLVNDAVPASVVAATVTAPAACGGATASTLVELRMLTESAGMPSNVTAAPNRFVPVSVTPVPPVTGPDVGDTLVKVGAAATYV